MWYVYVLKSKTDKNYIYIGSTSNLRKRLLEHNAELSKLSTASYKPLELISYVATKSQTTARNLEKHFKSGSGKAFLKKRILTDEA